MPDILNVFFIWWKKILLTILITTAMVALVLWLLPNEYLSVTTALPANSATADKARIFNTQIEALYSDIGTSDELDKIIGTAQLDTIYLAAAQRYQLAAHYAINGTKNNTVAAAKKLKKNTRVIKSEYGELQVKVWDKSPQQAAVLANALLASLQQLHQYLQGKSNQLVLQQLQKNYSELQQQYEQISSQSKSVTVANDIVSSQKAALLQQLQQYQQLITEYTLARQTNPQVLLVVEPARPSIYHDRPQRLQWLLLVAVASGLFALLVAVYTESRKRHAV